MKNVPHLPVVVAGAVLLLLAGVAAYVGVSDPPEPEPEAPPPHALAPGTETHQAPETDQGFLYGRLTTTDGETYAGRLRWGGTEEAFWGDAFNGFKDENPWVVHVQPEQLKERRPIEIFGVEIASRERTIDVGRPFMARFGDIARIEARGRDIRVTLRSGTVFDLDRFAADDLADGVRVWDSTHGVVDFGERQIDTIEFLPTPSLDAAPYRLHGTVRTAQGDFTGFLQWNRELCVGTDEVGGVRFDAIRSIARNSRDSALVTLLDGHDIVLLDTPEVGRGNRGIYVDDPRYGRVLISWDAFERVELSPAGSGPAYDDFPTGHPLTGSVTTRAGRTLTGRLVFDLDESETTETLDAPSEGVDYIIPFGLIASIVPSGRVTLHGGEELRLERTGDLGEKNAGMLIFIDGHERPEYVPWTDVEQVSLDRPPAMHPPLDER